MELLWGQSSNYYPQGNGLAKSTNKSLIHILKKIIEKNQINQHLKFIDGLWVSRRIPKDNNGMSPYTLVYGKEEKLPINLELNALTSMVNTEDAEDNSPIQRRINQLLKLEEEISKSMNQTSQRQKIIKRYFDQSATVKNFRREN
jgi:hypothetical protein